MAKLTDRQKNNLIAKFKTGTYTNIELAKKYKISESMVRKITKGINKENSHIVEAGVVLENAKKCEKSAIEIKEIDNAIKYRLEKEYSDDNKRLRVYDASFKILDKVNDILEKGKVPEKVNKGDGIQQIEEREINASDAEKLANAVDKISVTTNVNQRHSNTQLSVNTQNNNVNTVNTKTLDDFYKDEVVEIKS